MDEFCGSEFWNVNVTWNTSDPDFTYCFQRTVLVWAPCVFLWTFSLLDFFYIRNSINRNIPWNYLNITKFVITDLLILITFIDFIIGVTKKDSYAVDSWTPIIKLFTFVLSVILLYYNKQYGLQTSGLLFIFWFFLVLFSIPQFRTEVRKHQERIAIDSTVQSDWGLYYFISFMIFFWLSAIMLILNAFADHKPLQTKYPASEKPSPELHSSFLSRLLFAWFDPLVWKGYRKPLENDDLWDMKPEDSSKEVMPIFAKYWDRSVAKARGTAIHTPKDIDGNAHFAKNSASVNITTPKKQKQASILPAICKAFGPTFLFGSILKLAQDLLTFVSPQILRLIIQFVDDTHRSIDEGSEPEPLWRGILYACLLFIIAGTQTLFLAQYFQRMMVVGLRIRTALISSIYRKALILSSSAKRETTVGEVVNLMAVDAQRFMDLTTYINMIWSAPLQIALALYFLWAILGPSVLAGLAVMIILIPVNGFIANKIKNFQIKQMKYKDERVKLMNEILSGIKVLKLYAWEPSFEAQVHRIRDKEIKVLRSAAYLNAATSFIWSCAPFLVSLVTFVTFVYSDDDNILTPEKAFVCLTLFDIIRMPLAMFPLLLVYMVEVSLVTFAVFVMVDEDNVLSAETAFVSLSLFNILRFPLSMLPMLITNMVQTSVSVNRINKFMNAEELDPNNVQHDPAEKTPLIIENGTFSWGGEHDVLKSINMRIEKGTVAAVVGKVGSGKSSLISAFLGEMEKVSGRVNTIGSIAYVSQQAWIQNCTLQDNILFGKSMDRKLYNKVLEACALKPDIEMLPGGDQTEIGEKGINLSGGQKQRVSLARAVYNDADVYFLDDPLSAVDSHVGKHIFEEVVGPHGLLKGKTRILVTHSITYLPQVDNIYVVLDGEISESGNYQALLNRKGAFADFLIEHIQESNVEPDELDDLKQQIESTIADTDLIVKLERAISRTRSESESNQSDNSRKNSLSRENSVDDGVRRRTPSKRDSESTLELKEPETKDKLIEQEKAEVGNVKWDVYKHYLKSIGLWLSILTICLNIIFQVFSIGSNVWLSRWSSDTRVANDTGLRDMYLGVYGAFGMGQAIAVCSITYCLARGALGAALILHNTLVNNVLRIPMKFFDTTPIGRVLSRISTDINILDYQLPEQVKHGLATLMRGMREMGRLHPPVIGTLVIISVSTPLFMVVILPIGFLYYFAQRFYVATSRQLKRLESVSRSPIYSHFGESIQGSPTIRAYHVQERFIHESEDKVDFNQVCYYPSIISNRWLAVRLEMIGNLIILFSALFAVLSYDTMDAGTVGLSISYALSVTQTLNWLVRMTSDVETNIVAVERIKEYGETQQEAPWSLAQDSTLPKDWPQAGKIIFRDLAVRYREGLDLVLKGINFTVGGGEKVGIVGRTGAGKSSLTMALFRIIESAGGSIIIDEQDISKLGLHALRSRLTIIPQDPVLFSGSFRINLDPFEMYSDEQLWKALEHAHLKPFVKGLTAGLNHEISEGGENLSVGQRQLVCLARALLRKTKVLVLDEATAAVDLETDDLIQKTIRTEFNDCSVLTIAHRLNTIMDSDKVIVLDKGRVTEFAPPNDLLLDKKSAFYSMAKDAGLV